jgi:ABC-type sugar transport system substrate-binding protein
MTAMKIVGGYTPGKNIEVIGYGGAKEIVSMVKTGTVYATLGLYPVSESLLGIQYLDQALKGKSVPKVVDIVNPVSRPAVIDQAYLKAHPTFVPDWTLEGGIG